LVGHIFRDAVAVFSVTHGALRWCITLWVTMCVTVVRYGALRVCRQPPKPPAAGDGRQRRVSVKP